MKTVLLCLLSLISVVVMGQPSHWRYGLYIGQAKPFTSLTTAQPIATERLSIYSPAGVNLQATLERSIRANLSLRASLGYVPIGYSFSTQYVFRDTTGQILGRFGSGARSLGSSLTVGTLGFTINSRAIGRTIITAGIGGVVRVNGTPDQDGRKTGGRSNSSVVYQGQTQSHELIYEFETQRVSPVTVGLALRAGMDYRITKRGLFSMEVRYTKGLGYVRQAQSTELRVDGVGNEGSYSSRASNIAVQVGYKHSLFRVNPLGRLQFTPYNQPELNSRHSLTPEQRQSTFQARTWQYELRGSYRPMPGAVAWGVGSNAGYFLSNRLLAGLSADYQQYGDDYSRFVFGRLLQVGPFIRAYAGRGRIAPYLEGGYQAGLVSGPLTPARFVSSVPVTVGFSVRVNESVRVQASYAMRYAQQSRVWFSSLPQLSLTFSPKHNQHPQP